MKSVYIFPLIQIAVCLGAAIVYAFAKDWRKATYWSAAAILTVTVTF